MSNSAWMTVVILKHWILLLLSIGKFIFIGIFAIVLSFIGFYYAQEMGKEVTLYLIFPLVFALVNYSFFRLILSLIEYYNYSFVIGDEQIYVVNASFIMRDDVEVIESYKIIKINAFSRGFFQNILWYGTVTIELQTKEQRKFHFMPNPYNLLQLLQNQRKKVLQARGKKIVEENIINEENNEK